MTKASFIVRYASAIIISFGLVFASAAFAADEMSKDGMKKEDAMSKDSMKKDDAMSKESMKKNDAMSKDAMSKDSMKKDEMHK